MIKTTTEVDKAIEVSERSILLVEDDRSISRFLELVITKHGYHNGKILKSNSAEAAGEIITSTRGHLDIITDYKLAGKETGIDLAIKFAETIHQRLGQLIMLSGINDPKVMEIIECLIRKKIINCFMEKPCSIQQIRAAFPYKQI
jgi:DNA-binding NtrC family response regulator